MASKRISAVLKIIEWIRDGRPGSVEDVTALRKKAFQGLALEKDTNESTVRDMCHRQLRLTKDEAYSIDDFDHGVWAWLQSGDAGMRKRIEKCVGQRTSGEDLAAVQALFSVSTPNSIGRAKSPVPPTVMPLPGVTTSDPTWAQRVTLLEDCVAWIELDQGQPSIVVASIGGGQKRRTGLGLLVRGLRRFVVPLAIGYHATGKQFVDLPDLSPDLRWEDDDPGAVLERSVDRIPGANQGSRLRFRFSGVTVEQLFAFLRRLVPASGREIVDHVHRTLTASGLTFTREQIADFYLSLRTKPFVLLAGISGTGKSLLPRRFARACGFPCDLIPVRPDWSDPGDLLGYRNLKDAFVPGRLLPVIVRAWSQPDRPHFVVLDEMNLARVEHYFADVLSLLETRTRRDGRIETDDLLKLDPDGLIQGEASEREALQAQLRRGPIRIPSNLCFIGTVNMDESTHPFSRKVLDRAMTLEFNEVDLNNIQAMTGDPPVPLDVPETSLLADRLGLAEVWTGNEEHFFPAIGLLTELNKTLRLCNSQVGFRVRDEICIYLHHARMQDLLPPHAALDLAIHHKILPRLQGGVELTEPLRLVREVLTRHALGRCLQKIDEMEQRLRDTSYTAFWS